MRIVIDKKSELANAMKPRAVTSQGFNFFVLKFSLRHFVSLFVGPLLCKIFARAFNSPIVRSPRSRARSGSHHRQSHLPSSVSVVMYDPHLQSGVASICSGPIVKNRNPGGGSIGLTITAAGLSAGCLGRIRMVCPQSC
jgi:hypothetical protein